MKSKRGKSLKNPTAEKWSCQVSLYVSGNQQKKSNVGRSKVRIARIQSRESNGDPIKLSPREAEVIARITRIKSALKAARNALRLLSAPLLHSPLTDQAASLIRGDTFADVGDASLSRYRWFISIKPRGGARIKP